MKEKLAICESEVRSGRIKIKCDGKLLLKAREEVEAVNGGDLKVAKSIGRLLEESERNNGGEEDKGKESTCQEKCKKAEEEARKASNLLDKSKKGLRR